MKAGINHAGYPYVNLTPPCGGRYQTFRVHRLVLMAFVGPCPEGMVCRHLNGVKTDNRPENLARGTPEENYADNRRLGVYQRGESHAQAKLTAGRVRFIRWRYGAGGSTLQRLADEHGVSLSAVHNIIHRRSWKHVD